MDASPTKAWLVAHRNDPKWKGHYDLAFGKRPAFTAGLIVFTCAYLCLFVLGWFRFVPRPLAFLALVFYALHLYWSLRALRRQLDPQIVDQFQIQYRALYAVIGIAMLCGLFFK